jgi:hypothetical protein
MADFHEGKALNLSSGKLLNEQEYQDFSEYFFSQVVERTRRG